MMGDRVLFADAEKAAINYLRPLLGTTVVATVPKPRPTTFVAVGRFGGVNRNDIVDAATLLVECWAGSKGVAHDLAATAWAELRALDGGAWIADGIWCYRVDTVGGPTWRPDPESEQPRYEFSVSLALRGSLMS